MITNENDSQEEITVTVETPAPDPAPDPAPAPAVVIVEDAAPAAPAGDAVLAAVLDISERLTRVELALTETATTAAVADMKADEALAQDAEIIAVAETAVAAAEAAAEEPQAPAAEDETPARKHWLHR